MALTAPTRNAPTTRPKKEPSMETTIFRTATVDFVARPEHATVRAEVIEAIVARHLTDLRRPVTREILGWADGTFTFRYEVTGLVRPGSDLVAIEHAILDALNSEGLIAADDDFVLD